MRKKPATLSFVQHYYREDLKDRVSPASRFYLPWLQHIVGERVLSLGCGPNLFDDAEFFGKLPSKLVGIDINEANIRFLQEAKHPELRRCKETLTRYGAEISLQTGDICKTNDAFCRSFDAVYAVGCIAMQTSADVARILSNIRMYLVPGGTCLIIDWGECLLPKKAFEKRLGYGWYSADVRTVKELKHAIEAAGLIIDREEVFDVPDKPAYMWGKVYAFLAHLDR